MFHANLYKKYHLLFFMEKKVMVISLGGSLIVPEKVDLKFLKNLNFVRKKITSMIGESL